MAPRKRIDGNRRNTNKSARPKTKASRKQIEANRRNAQRSTGPKTKRGKNISRWNRLDHGLRAEKLVLPDEDPQEYEAFVGDLLEEMEPVGLLQTEVAAHFAHCLWLLRRYERAEARLLAKRNTERFDAAALNAFTEEHGLKNDFPGLSPAQYLHQIMILRLQAIDKGEPLWKLPLSEIPTKDLIEFYKETLEDEQQSNPATYDVGVAFQRSMSQGLAKLPQYKDSLYRTLFRLLHEFERLQAAREAKAAEKAKIIDVMDHDDEES